MGAYHQDCWHTNPRLFPRSPLFLSPHLQYSRVQAVFNFNSPVCKRSNLTALLSNALYGFLGQIGIIVAILIQVLGKF